MSSYKILIILSFLNSIFCENVNIIDTDFFDSEKVLKFLMTLNDTKALKQILQLYDVDTNVYKFAKAPDLLKESGYEMEIHHVTTKDGYILEMHRMQNGSVGTNGTAKRPMFLMHGLGDSSTGWLINGRENSLGYFMADAGYDVWLGNARGTFFSRKHKTWNPDGDIKDKQKFWTYSWHEIGVYDLPAMIDYVLKTNTAFNKVHYAGLSQGTTSFFVMGSERPAYNKKILTMHALAPVAFMRKSQGLGKAAAYLAQTIEPVLRPLGILEILPGDTFITTMLQKLCSDLTVARLVCMNFLFMAVGFDPKLIRPENMSHFTSHIPAGMTIYQPIHYAQQMQSDYFQKYDYGKLANRKKYGSFNPPKYPLHKITAPVALHYGSNDFFAHVDDVQKLANELPNLIGKFNVEDQQFNHVDFVLAYNVGQTVYKDMLKIMKKYE